MTELTCEDFKAMGIVELVEFIDKQGETIEEYEEELEKYFKMMKPESVVPYYYYNAYVDVEASEKYDMISDFTGNIKLEDKPKALSMPDEFYELHWMDKKRVERTSSKYEIRNTLYQLFLYEGNRLFLEDMQKKGYFESGKVQVILERYLRRIHASRYEKNEDIMIALAIFIKEKDEKIQMMITELIVEYVERSEQMIRILLYTYKHGISYAKRGALYAFSKNAWRLEIDFSIIQSFLDAIAADLESEDILLKQGVVDFIDYFISEYESVSEDEVNQYLLEEKGIVYDNVRKAIYEEVMKFRKEINAAIEDEERIIRRYFVDEEHEGRF